MLGQAKRQCSVNPETSWVYNPDVPCYAYDPEMAIPSLRKPAIPIEDGKMLDANGNQLQLKLPMARIPTKSAS